MASLVLAQVCGILPNERMKKDNFDSIEQEMKAILFLHYIEASKLRIEKNNQSKR